MTPQTTTVANFAVQYLQFLDANSHPTQTFPEFANPDTLLYLYRQMALIRHFDNKAVNLQRTGKMGTYPSSRGQEAVGIGMGNAMEAEDIFCPYYRDQGTYLERGIKLSEFLTYWGGDERGSNYSNPNVKDDFPNCVPIAGQLLHAAGVAYAIKYRKQHRAVVTICGDGGTSKGDFYEAINLAGCWQLPVVFVVNNNQWAISVGRNQQTSCQTLAQKAIAGGFDGWQVDGNDVIAVRYSVSKALEKARVGGGPTLIEAITYRLCDHTTADDASRYTPSKELKIAWKREPIARLGYYLESQGLWSRDQETELQTELANEVDQIVKEFLNRPLPKPTDMFDYLYAELPKSLKKQRHELIGEEGE
ncbi:pyruvate dehydrogenase (acetyl-transferring) E1 component subunit alpha [Coxiella-like endosymbiont of Rhipicephalus sanguineus]|uniref:pyruvate dehydrogenase (acetyl-transferring) E1 component subunit alpha n=1 Tax=Coxiella-like endosymbiont of Rhipicephalus sanguineus TaxID=1955402 RepID=UPI00203E85CD|nr:pyruvate dehydrogenase (acetyl-transferring) E1 component subunit alpha [Coxiella-like endosymbiont of Rhipicephalus sanguineus]MBT8506823.1 pyruvate dehydrogenase (acetyl-transferring) E1 component subunit alpha [Coxiella-like endosymbiont of Rhipicephalus sanguineus]